MSKLRRTAEGYWTDHYYESKTSRGFSWQRGYYIERVLTRSFPTLEAAQKFADGKNVLDIFRKNGKYVVEWVKTIENIGTEFERKF